jgi:hypothetical protein
MTIWYILCSVGSFFLVLVSCTKKNLATLLPSEATLAFIFSPEHPGEEEQAAGQRHEGAGEEGEKSETEIAAFQDGFK